MLNCGEFSGNFPSPIIDLVMHFGEHLLLVEEVESDAVLPSLHHVIVEGRRVPAMPALSLIGLFT